MHTFPNTDDLFVFLMVVKCHSFVKAADQLGVSRSYVSKRIQVIEDLLGYKLLHRTSRTLALTAQGEKVKLWASEIMLNFQKMNESLNEAGGEFKGQLYITSSLGFGRQHIAPLLSQFARQYPKITIKFNTTDTIQDLIAEHVDLDIHIGNQIAPHMIAQKLASNNRILVASPHYLSNFGEPKILSELLSHNCLIIQERDSTYANWKLTSSLGEQQIKVRGTLSSNHGELIRQWALDGHGIILRSQWDIQQDIEQGALVHILPDYWQSADIHAIYPSRLNHSPKLKCCVDFLKQHIPLRLQ